MKPVLFRFLFCNLAAALCSFAQDAAPPETPIPALVEEALAHNPELAFYRAEIAIARGERKSAGARPNPEAEVELGRKRSQPKSGGLAQEGSAWAVSVSQSFDWPNRLALRKAIANRQVELAETGLAQFQRDLASEVRLAAYRLLVAQEKQAAAESVARRGEELIQVLLQRDPAGATPLLETRIIEATLLTLKHRANLAARDARSAALSLNQLRGQPLAAPIRVAPTTLRFPDLADAEAFVGLAHTNNFEIKAKVIELRQQGLKVDLAKNERYPSFTVRPFFSQETAADREQSAGVGVSIPLPLWNRNQGNVDAAQSRQEQAAASLTLTQRSVEKQLREKLAHYALDQREMASWRSGAVGQLHDAADLANRHYRLGSIPISTFLEMQTRYLEGMETVLETQAQAIETLQHIERLTGVPIASAVGPAPKDQP